jgi:ABC-type molybdate transport system ATPase subunit
MQRKTAHQLIADTRHLVGRELTLQVLDPATDRLTDRRVRIVANDVVVNLKDPAASSRVCLDVYATAEDLDTGEAFHLSLDKLAKQRG